MPKAKMNYYEFVITIKAYDERDAENQAQYIKENNKDVVNIEWAD